MFPRVYFAGVYFAPVYFAQSQGLPPTPPTTGTADYLYYKIHRGGR